MHYVEVKWVDAHCASGWEDRPRKVREPVIVSVGQVIKSTRKGIILALSYDKALKTINGEFFIPAGCIKKITELHRGTR